MKLLKKCCEEYYYHDHDGSISRWCLDQDPRLVGTDGKVRFTDLSVLMNLVFLNGIYAFKLNSVGLESVENIANYLFSKNRLSKLTRNQNIIKTFNHHDLNNHLWYSGLKHFLNHSSNHFNDRLLIRLHRLLLLLYLTFKFTIGKLTPLTYTFSESVVLINDTSYLLTFWTYNHSNYNVLRQFKTINCKESKDDRWWVCIFLIAGANHTMICFINLFVLCLINSKKSLFKDTVSHLTVHNYELLERRAKHYVMESKKIENIINLKRSNVRKLNKRAVVNLRNLRNLRNFSIFLHERRLPRGVAHLHHCGWESRRRCCRWGCRYRWRRRGRGGRRRRWSRQKKNRPFLQNSSQDWGFLEDASYYGRFYRRLYKNDYLLPIISCFFSYFFSYFYIHISYDVFNHFNHFNLFLSKIYWLETLEVGVKVREQLICLKNFEINICCSDLSSWLVLEYNLGFKFYTSNPMRQQSRDPSLGWLCGPKL